jgi:hypothetical protein
MCDFCEAGGGEAGEGQGADNFIFHCGFGCCGCSMVRYLTRSLIERAKHMMSAKLTVRKSRDLFID